MQRTKQEDALMSQVANLEQQLHAKRAELLAYRVSQCGVSVGQVVVTKKGRFRVAEVEPTSWGKPWLMVNPQKKDGEFGERVVRLYSDDWTVEVDHAS